VCTYGVTTTSLDLEAEEFVMRTLITSAIRVKLDEEELADHEIFEITGPPHVVFQNCCREQGMLDALIAMLAAPPSRGIIMESAKDDDEATLLAAGGGLGGLGGVAAGAAGSGNGIGNGKKGKSAGSAAGAGGKVWLDSRFKRIANIHRLAWCAVKFLLQDNTLSEEHLVSIHVSYRKITAAARKAVLEKLSRKQRERQTLHDSNPQRADGEMGDDGDLEEEEEELGGAGSSPLGAAAAFLGLKGKNTSSNNIGNPLPSKRASVVLDGLQTISALNVLISQIQFPVYAAETLTAILHGNRNLLEQVVDEERIRTFVELIKQEGPSDQFLDFFAAICSCDGEAMRKNQDLCLEELVLNQECFRKTLLTIKAFSSQELAAHVSPNALPHTYTIPSCNGLEGDVYGFEVRSNNCGVFYLFSFG
jgi:hypothetical protein